MRSVDQTVSTGDLPAWDHVKASVDQAYRLSVDVHDGAVTRRIPALSKADPGLFGICVAGVSGRAYGVGDADHLFSIQSISKAFVYALVCDAVGHDVVLDRVGVNNTGQAFDSVMAIELNEGHPMNPMVNAGAIATTALAPGTTPEARWAFVRRGLSRFAGRELHIDTEVYESETATNQRNLAIARLLESYDRIDGDPMDAVDVYTRQCALMINAHDLAVMGATLADGGVNPLTGDQVVPAAVCNDTLAVLATSGLYERSGEWLFEIGVPGKSGVGGGIVAAAPGKGGIGTFSPRLDTAGNSVRGQRATAYLSRSLGLNLFASTAHPHSARLPGAGDGHRT